MRKNLIFIFIVFLCHAATAQREKPPDITINIRVMPPFPTGISGYLSDPERILIRLNSNSGSVDIKLKATLTGDNGILIVTSTDYMPPAPIHLDPNSALSLNGTDLKNYLGFDNVTVRGISKTDLFNGTGLPEGNYTLCLEAYEYRSGALVSQASPSGCSNTFNIQSVNIQQVQPPKLISPACNDIELESTPQHIEFSWIKPAGITSSLNYRLKIVDLVPVTRNPDEALNSRGTPAFFETTINTTGFTYGPSSPVLQPGHTYAWQVTAIDPGLRNPVQFVNNGKSEACSFTYSKSAEEKKNVPFKVVPVIKKEIERGPVTLPYIVKGGTSTLTGNIKYFFAPDMFAPGSAYPLNHVPIRLVKEYFIHYFEENVDISLTSNFLTVSPNDQDYPDDVDFNFLNAHQVKVVSYGTTDKDGNFVFAFPSADRTNDYGQVEVTGLPDFWKNPNGKKMPKFAHTITVYDPNTGGKKDINVPGDKTGKEYMFSMLCIEILNPHYWGPLEKVPDEKYSPLKDNYSVYFEDTLELKNLGQINAYAPDFNFKVQLKLNTAGNAYDKPADHSKFNVYVLRKKSTSGNYQLSEGEGDMNYSFALPPGESQKHYDNKNFPVFIPDKIKNSNYEVVAFASTDKDGKCDFTRMLCFSGNPLYYFYATADPENDLNYAMPEILSLQNLIPSGINFNDNNPTRKLTLTLEPANGMLFGFVRRNDSKYVVKDAQVSLSVNSNFINQVNTDFYGYYEFTPFVGGIKTFNLIASKENFLDDEKTFTGPLELGKKIHTDLFIDTAASVFGKITDEDGEGIDAYVSLLNGASVKTKSGNYFTYAKGYEHLSPSTFKIGCPKGQQHLIIDPVDNHFEQKIVDLNVTKSLIDLGTIVVKRKGHTIKFIVLEYSDPINAVPAQYDDNGNAMMTIKKTIEKAIISIPLLGFTGVNNKITNKNGEADIDLWNTNAINLTVKVEGPEASNYIPNTSTVSLMPGNNSQTVYLYMKKGCKVEGWVSAGDKPVPGATVIFKNGSPANWQITTTASNGYYTFYGVPKGNGLTFVAGRQGYVGDEKKANTNLLTSTSVMFDLTTNSKIDFTEMLGFKMVVTKYDAANQLLSGYFHKLPDNDDFKVLQDTLIPFSSVKVKTIFAPKSGKTYFYPDQMPVKTELNTMELSAKGFNVRVQLNDEAKGIEIVAVNGGSFGSISAKTKIDIAAIQDATDLVFNDELFLRSASAVTQPDAIETITANGIAPYNTGLPLSNASGNDIHFTYQGFSITASHLKSVVTGNQVCHLEGFLSGHFITDENVQKAVSIPITNFEFSDHNGVENRGQKNASFEIPVQQWKIVADDYTLGPEGFHINSGHVQTTVVNVPFTDMVMKHNFQVNKEELKYGTYEPGKLDLAGVADLVIDPGAVSQFFYDPNLKLWQLIVAGPGNTKIGSIQGLTPINKNLNVSSFSLNSKNANGHLQLTDDSKFVNIYNGLASYAVSYIDVSPGVQLLNLAGGVLNTGIPGLLPDKKENSLSFRKQNGAVVVDVIPFTLAGYVQGIHLSFPVPKDAFQPNGFSSAGILYEGGNNPYQLNVILNHSSNSNIISIDPNSNKTLYVDQEKTRSISNISGSMQTAAGNSWSKFKFEGDLTGCKDVSSHLKFTINGDIGLDPGQKVAVASMKSDGGTVSEMKFDFAKGELRAKINIPKEDLGGGIGFEGNATMVVNKSGWFFAGNGNASFPNPFIDGAAAIILFGNYPDPGQDADIKNIFSSSYFYKKNNSLPPGYQQQLNGFLIDAKISKNIIPPTSISWGTGDLDVSVSAEADVYFGAQFTPLKSLVIGGMVGASANLSASQSLGIVCVKGAASAYINSFFTGSVDGNKKYCLTIGGEAGINGSLEVKAGGCNGKCNSILGLTPCVNIIPPIGAGLKLSLSYTMGNQPNCNTGISASLQ